MAWGEKKKKTKNLAAEAQGEVSSKAQWNGPASGHEGDSLPLLPTLMPQPLENEVIPLLHPPPISGPSLSLPSGLQQKSLVQGAPLPLGSCEPPGHLGPFRQT